MDGWTVFGLVGDLCESNSTGYKSEEKDGVEWRVRERKLVRDRKRIFFFFQHHNQHLAGPLD